MLKNLISMTALVVLLGCEHQGGNTESPVADGNITIQSQLDDSILTNAVDSKAVVAANGPLGSILTNHEPTDLDGVFDGGFILYGVDILSNSIYVIQDDGSEPTNSLTSAGF